MALPIIISIAGVLVRTTASQLPKLLGRFKNAKQVKNPSAKQVDEAKRLDSDYSNFGKGDKSTLIKKDSKHPSFMEKFTNKGITKGQAKIGNVGQQTGQAARNKFKLAGETVKLAGVAGILALDRELKLSASMKKKLKAAKTQEQYDTLVRLAISEQKQKEKEAKNKIKKPLRKPKEIDKIGAVKKPLRKPKGMK
mgnify:CR=1 FL=1|tara:strand:- start:275 stop:859 length:585 start_codon:yes stop_codon:yes gene_type:complete